MRIMLDTNILISAIVFRGRVISDLIKKLADGFSLVLCSYVIYELHDTIQKKFPGKASEIEQFLLELPFEYVYTPRILPKDLGFNIRDEDDIKVLYSAIISDVDVLITGDNDFSNVEIERPEILKPSAFLEKY
jgi:putative PIN family toxin of toxin-antitoxin system